MAITALSRSRYYRWMSTIGIVLVLIDGFDGSFVGTLENITKSTGQTLVVFNACLMMLHTLVVHLGSFFFFPITLQERKTLESKLVNALIQTALLLSMAVDITDLGECMAIILWLSPCVIVRLALSICASRFLRQMDEFGWTASSDQVAILGVSALTVYTMLGYLWFGFHTFIEPLGPMFTFVLLFAGLDVLLLGAKTFAVYLLYWYDAKYHEGSWESTDEIQYKIQLFYNISQPMFQLVHYGSLQYVAGMSMSLGDLVLWLQCRYVWKSMMVHLQAHNNYKRLIQSMDETYPCLSAEELGDRDDTCAICRESMARASELPCKHLFHRKCLLTWLKSNSTCPNCRLPLLQDPNIPPGRAPDGAPGPAAPVQNEGPRWMPEQINPMAFRRAFRVNDEDVARIQDLLPHLPRRVIVDTLARTGDVEIAIAALLDAAEQEED